MSTRTPNPVKTFADLGPDRILNLVERALAVPLTNLFRTFDSYINRVYELI